MVAIVAVAYKIPFEIVSRFLRNHAAYPVFLVTDDVIFHLENHRTIKAPDMDIFSLTRCSNIGIAAAISSGHHIIVKTDIDCVLNAECMDWINDNVHDGLGVCLRYWGVKPDQIDNLESAQLMPRICGTCAMTAHDWLECGMYNDAMQGYGYDDFDIVMKARTARITMPQLTMPKVFHIDHGTKHNRDTVNPLNRDFNRSLRQR